MKTILALLITFTATHSNAQLWNAIKKTLNTPGQTVQASDLEIVNPPNGNHEVKNFEEAKKIFKKTHYLGATKTAYCNCSMTSWNTFTNKDCGYVNEKYENQWHKIEAEHLVPVSQIVSGTKAYKYGDPSCGKEKGRKCTGKIYGFLFGDLWILIQSETELNRVHSNYQWEELGSKGKKWGTCDFYYADKKVQPPKALKGLIARAYMYIQDTYKVKVISNKNEKLYAIWAKYPPSADQCQRAKQILKVQKNENKYEINACKEANLW